MDGFSGSFTASLAASLEKARARKDVVKGEENDDSTRRAREAREAMRWGMRVLIVDSDGGDDDGGEDDDDDVARWRRSAQRMS